MMARVENVGLRRIRVRLDGPGGCAMDKAVLRTVYASGMDFEPEERRQEIMPDGTVELSVTCPVYMVHARFTVPLYGCIWVMADNRGRGYSGDFVDFVSEAVRTYTHEAETCARGILLSAAAGGHLAAAREYSHLADRGQNTPENRLYALSHAILAAEAALFEASAAKVYALPRTDLLMGCNFSRFTTPGARYAKYFAQAFDYATLPFYPARTVPDKGRYEYGYIDAALDFLTSRGIAAKGHPLWFGHEGVNPDWLRGLRGEEVMLNAREIAAHHAETYRGKISYWDAMNEAHDWANCFELSQDEELELTRACCDALHEKNGGTAIVNVCLPFAEYAAGRYVCYGSLPEKLFSPLAYLRALLDRNVAFDAVGIQLYFPARDMVAVNRMLNVFASLGKPVHITEMGVNGGTRGADGRGSAWAQLGMSEGTWHGGWNEHTQADWMEQFYTIAAAREEIKALTWWDFMEPSFFGNGAFLYEDETPREIFFRLLALKGRICNKSGGS